MPEADRTHGSHHLPVEIMVLNQRAPEELSSSKHFIVAHVQAVATVPQSPGEQDILGPCFSSMGLALAVHSSRRIPLLFFLDATGT